MAGTPLVTREEAAQNAWHLQGALAELTRTADAKASFALAIESAALAAIAAIANSEHGLGDVSGVPGHVLLWTGLVLLCASVVLAALAVVPRHGGEGRTRPTRPDDFVFYGHIRHLDPEELAESLCGHDPLPALSRQLIAVSRILWTKQQLVRLSLLTAVSGSALIALGVLIG